jgi:hypothetical protein
VAYSLCAACGAKTLVGATRCPRCQTPLVSYAADAKRPETVRCPSCGILRPLAIGICPNCHAGPEPPARRSLRGLLMASGAVVVILGIGYAVSRIVGPSEPVPSPVTDGPPVVTSPMLPDREPTDSASAAGLRADSTGRRAVGLTAQPGTPAKAADTSAIPTGSGTRPTPASTVNQAAPAGVYRPATQAVAEVPPSVPAPAPDSGWSYWRATTWVRLRDKPGRDGEEVRMIDSAQRVMLGPTANGWRAARVGTDRGWVDPRLFVPASRP